MDVVRTDFQLPPRRLARSIKNMVSTLSAAGFFVALVLCAGCVENHSSAPELVEGGVYVVDSFLGNYEVARVLALRYDAVLYYMYENVYAEIPDEVLPGELIVRKSDDGTMFLGAMRVEVFKQAHPRFLFHEDLTALQEAFVRKYEPYLAPEMRGQDLLQLQRENRLP